MTSLLAQGRQSPWVLAVFALYLGTGLAGSSWLTRIPTIAQSLDLGPAALGALLLTQTAAAFGSVSFSGVIVLRLGVRRTVAVCSIMVAAGLVLLGVGVSVWVSLPVVVGGMLLCGLGSATWNVASNVEGTALEQSLGRSIMPMMHGFFSVGTVLGAVVGAIAAASSVSLAWHLGVVSMVIVLAMALALPRLQGGTSGDAGNARSVEPHPVSSQMPVITGTLPAVNNPGPAGGTDGTPVRSPGGVLAAWKRPRTLLVGLFVLGMALTEGAANDWVALALTDGYGASAAVGALGYGIFVAAMTTGRMSGTWLIDRYGRITVLRAACVLALVGLAVFVFSPSTTVGLCALLLWGLGASLGFPVGMSAAADDSAQAAANVSVVSTIGYAAFLGGPPLLGLVGEVIGVREALGLVMFFVALSFALIPWLRPPGATAAPDTSHAG